MNTFDLNNTPEEAFADDLTAKDRARFQSFGISKELTAAAGIRRVSDAVARDLCGVYHKGDLAGVAFPTIGLSGYVIGWRLRRDHPEMEDDKPKQKWMNSRDPAHLYFTPETRKWISDPTIPVVFVEACTSALAIEALCERAGRQFCVVGTGGCWSWRGQIGIAISEDGSRVPEKGPLADLAHIDFNERNAIICFDSNLLSNSSVQAGLRAFGRELDRRGAQVLVASVPDRDGINGPDDLLAAAGDTVLLDILDQAVPVASSPAIAKQALADKIVDLILSGHIELFHRTVDEPYATVEVQGHRETWPILSKGFRRWVSRRFWEAHRKAPNAHAVQDALNVISGKAIHDAPEQAVHVRLAEHAGKLYLDLCDERWNAVEIGPAGWQVVTEVPVKFVRARGMLPLPIPQPGGNLDNLRAFLNVGTHDQWTLVKAWLIAAFRPGYPFVILILTGEQGSAKSSFQRILRSLIDPNKAPLRSFPREPRDLMIAASNGWICAFDNISSIPQWLSDDLCRLATGGGFSTRELYSDADERIFDAMRPIMLNGISDVSARPDLLDRSMIFNLPTIPDARRRDEEELQASFQASRPKFLGALLDHVVGALRTIQNVHLDSKPRMADFARFAVAAERGSGDDSGHFLHSYMTNRSTANVVALENSMIGMPLVRFMDDRESWAGTVGELFHELNAFVDERTTRAKNWPATIQKFSPELRRIAPNLRHSGLDIRFGRHTNRGVPIQLRKVGNTSSPSSPGSLPLTGKPSMGDEAGDAVPESSSPDVLAMALIPKASDERDESDEVFPRADDLERYEI